ncbi:HNH endonuclease [Mycobacterium phage Colt]|nr:HNH endonuclease [Mycobacterium phage Colt]
MCEEWRPVLNYEGFYEVSNRARVRSVDRVIIRANGSPMPYSSQILGQFRSPPSHYWTVTLRRNGQKINRRVHALVAEAFIGPKPFPHAEVCHRNGDKDDTRPDNLYWGTHSQNMRDSVNHGTHHQSGKTHCKRGHEFTPENTYMNPSSGGRQCRQCVRDKRGTKKPYGPRSRSTTCGAEHGPQA